MANEYMVQAEGNLYFGRRRDGGVRVVKLKIAQVAGWPQAEDKIEAGAAVLDFVIPPAVWKQIVDFVGPGK